ncbi:neuronal acetylcholine receptor subunit alpha-5-like [Anopheles moucheti]|uniref:neuronal acetylcholine receptor subunit alpha-5-like n=1 Tax=Anopheles moucheti TaxID=186751 RepID=UPI0022EFEE30|nr:neuronal acetylcholine receptor subunit alpha-5-like [Anopheles moucheti]
MCKVIFLLYVTTFCVILLVNSVVTINCVGETSSIEEKLQRKLLCSDYDKTQRPVKNHQTAVNATISIELKEFYVFDSDFLILAVYLTISWKDEYLTWNRADYDKEKVIIDSKELWRPTIEATETNNAGVLDKSCYGHTCEVVHNGSVTCVSTCNYEAHCTSTNADWPFEILKCTMHFSSWMEYSTQLNLTAEPKVWVDKVKDDKRWKLLSAETASRNDIDHESFPFIAFITTLERHMGVYTAIMTPGFMMVAVNLAVLMIDTTSSDRLHILTATCLGHYIFLQFMYWHLAYNSKDVPNILLFFRDSLLINVLMLIFTIVLRHTAPRKNSSERWMDRLALRAASTTMGSILLQADTVIDPKVSRPLEESQTEREHNRHAENSTNGDTINLVVDGYDRNNAPNAIIVSTVQHRADLGIIFMDRIMLFCCTICYAFMLFNLIPKKML